MIMSFGIKEAKEASKFAHTPEQRLTVLATMAMLGIKNKIKATVKKTRAKILSKAASNDNKIVRLNKKYDVCRVVERTQMAKLDEVTIIDAQWKL